VMEAVSKAMQQGNGAITRRMSEVLANLDAVACGIIIFVANRLNALRYYNEEHLLT
jgi:hypothetical protein